jgi:hypothetical protein
LNDQNNNKETNRLFSKQPIALKESPIPQKESYKKFYSCHYECYSRQKFYNIILYKETANKISAFFEVLKN